MLYIRRQIYQYFQNLIFGQLNSQRFRIGTSEHTRCIQNTTFRILLFDLSQAKRIGAGCVRCNLFKTPGMVKCCFRVNTHLYSWVRVKILMCLHLDEGIKQNKHNVSLSSSQFPVLFLVYRFIQEHPPCSLR